MLLAFRAGLKYVVVLNIRFHRVRPFYSGNSGITVTKGHAVVEGGGGGLQCLQCVILPINYGDHLRFVF